MFNFNAKLFALHHEIHIFHSKDEEAGKKIFFFSLDISIKYFPERKKMREDREEVKIHLNQM